MQDTSQSNVDNLNTVRHEASRHFRNKKKEYLKAKIEVLEKTRRMRWVGHVVHMGERRGIYRVLVGKPEGKRPLGTPKHRWEDNI